MLLLGESEVVWNQTRKRNKENIKISKVQSTYTSILFTGIEMRLIFEYYIKKKQLFLVVYDLRFEIDERFYMTLRLS